MLSESLNELRKSLFLFHKIYANKSDLELFICWLQKFFDKEKDNIPYYSYNFSNKIKKKNQKIFDEEDCWQVDLFSINQCEYKNFYFDENFKSDLLALEKYFFYISDSLINILKGSNLHEENLIYDIRFPKIFTVFSVPINISKASHKNKKDLKKINLYCCLYFKKFPKFRLNENRIFRILHFFGVSEIFSHKNEESIPNHIKQRIEELLDKYIENNKKDEELCIEDEYDTNLIHLNVFKGNNAFCNNIIYPNIFLDTLHKNYSIFEIAYLDSFEYTQLYPKSEKHQKNKKYGEIQKRAKEILKEKLDYKIIIDKQFKLDLLNDMNFSQNSLHPFILKLIDDYDHEIYSDEHNQIEKEDNYNINVNINIENKMINNRDANLSISEDVEKKSKKIILSLTEKNILKEKNNLILCGRSGTGKTTCILYKIFFSILNYNIHLQEKYAGKFSLKNLLKTSKDFPLKIVFTTYSFSLTEDIIKKINDMINQFSHKIKVDVNNIKINENAIFLQSFFDKNIQYPLFINFRKLLFMIDGTLKYSFFDRNLENPFQEKEDIFYNEDNRFSINKNNFKKFNFSELINEEKELEELLISIPNQKIKNNNQICLNNTMKNDKINNLTKKLEFSPLKNFILNENLIKKTNDIKICKESLKESNEEVFKIFFESYLDSNLQKQAIDNNLNSSLIYLQIFSIIKGSFYSHLSYANCINKKEYFNLGRKLLDVPNPDCLNIIWKVFLEYENWKITKGYFDIQDLTNYLIREVKKELIIKKNGITLIDYLFIDEIQDLPINQIYLLILVTKYPILFGGDTAQTISKGIRFRFEDLKLIFYDFPRTKISNILLNKNSNSNQNKKIIKSINYQNNNDYSQDIFTEILNNYLFEVPEIKNLSHNFRYGKSILKFSNFITNLIRELYPFSIDYFCPEYALNNESFIPTKLKDFNKFQEFYLTDDKKILKNNFEISHCVLCRNNIVKKEYKKSFNKVRFLEVPESKGLEFHIVIIYNFFKDSKFKNEWKYLLKTLIIEKKENKFYPLLVKHLEEEKINRLNDKYSFFYSILKEFEFIDYPIISQIQTNLNDNNLIKEKRKIENLDLYGFCTELKELYVALTRGRSFLLIYDESEIFEEFSKILTDKQLMGNENDDEIKNIVTKFLYEQIHFDEKEVLENANQYMVLGQYDLAEYYFKILNNETKLKNVFVRKIYDEINKIIYLKKINFIAFHRDKYLDFSLLTECDELNLNKLIDLKKNEFTYHDSNIISNINMNNLNDTKRLLIEFILLNIKARKFILENNIDDLIVDANVNLNLKNYLDALNKFKLLKNYKKCGEIYRDHLNDFRKAIEFFSLCGQYYEVLETIKKNKKFEELYEYTITDNNYKKIKNIPILLDFLNSSIEGYFNAKIFKYDLNLKNIPKKLKTDLNNPSIFNLNIKKELEIPENDIIYSKKHKNIDNFEKLFFAYDINFVNVFIKIFSNCSNNNILVDEGKNISNIFRNNDKFHFDLRLKNLVLSIDIPKLYQCFDEEIFFLPNIIETDLEEVGENFYELPEKFLQNEYFLSKEQFLSHYGKCSKSMRNFYSSIILLENVNQMEKSFLKNYAEDLSMKNIDVIQINFNTKKSKKIDSNEKIDILKNKYKVESEKIKKDLHLLRIFKIFDEVNSLENVFNHYKIRKLNLIEEKNSFLEKSHYKILKEKKIIYQLNDMARDHKNEINSFLNLNINIFQKDLVDSSIFEEYKHKFSNLTTKHSKYKKIEKEINEFSENDIDDSIFHFHVKDDVRYVRNQDLSYIENRDFIDNSYSSIEKNRVLSRKDKYNLKEKLNNFLNKINFADFEGYTKNLLEIIKKCIFQDISQIEKGIQNLINKSIDKLKGYKFHHFNIQNLLIFEFDKKTKSLLISDKSKEEFYLKSNVLLNLKLNHKQYVIILINNLINRFFNHYVYDRNIINYSLTKLLMKNNLLSFSENLNRFPYDFIISSIFSEFANFDTYSDIYKISKIDYKKIINSHKNVKYIIPQENFNKRLLSLEDFKYIIPLFLQRNVSRFFEKSDKIFDYAFNDFNCNDSSTIKKQRDINNKVLDIEFDKILNNFNLYPNIFKRLNESINLIKKESFDLNKNDIGYILDHPLLEFKYIDDINNDVFEKFLENLHRFKIIEGYNKAIKMNLFIETFIKGLEISVLFKNYSNLFKICNYLLIDRDIKLLIENYNNKSENSKANINPNHYTKAKEDYTYYNKKYFNLSQIYEIFEKFNLIQKYLIKFYDDLAKVKYQSIEEKYCLVSLFASYGFKICPNYFIFESFGPLNNFIIDFTAENFRRKNSFENLSFTNKIFTFFNDNKIKQFYDYSDIKLKCDSSSLKNVFYFNGRNIDINKNDIFKGFFNDKVLNFNVFWTYYFNVINEFILLIYENLFSKILRLTYSLLSNLVNFDLMKEKSFIIELSLILLSNFYLFSLKNDNIKTDNLYKEILYSDIFTDLIQYMVPKKIITENLNYILFEFLKEFLRKDNILNEENLEFDLSEMKRQLENFDYEYKLILKNQEIKYQNDFNWSENIKNLDENVFDENSDFEDEDLKRLKNEKENDEKNFNENLKKELIDNIKEIDNKNFEFEEKDIEKELDELNNFELTLDVDNKNNYISIEEINLENDKIKENIIKQNEIIKNEMIINTNKDNKLDVPSKLDCIQQKIESDKNSNERNDEINFKNKENKISTLKDLFLKKSENGIDISKSVIKKPTKPITGKSNDANKKVYKIIPNYTMIEKSKYQLSKQQSSIDKQLFFDKYLSKMEFQILIENCLLNTKKIRKENFLLNANNNTDCIENIFYNNTWFFNHLIKCLISPLKFFYGLPFYDRLYVGDSYQKHYINFYFQIYFFTLCNYVNFEKDFDFNIHLNFIIFAKFNNMIDFNKLLPSIKIDCFIEDLRRRDFNKYDIKLFQLIMKKNCLIEPEFLIEILNVYKYYYKLQVEINESDEVKEKKNYLTNKIFSNFMNIVFSIIFLHICNITNCIYIPSDFLLDFFHENYLQMIFESIKKGNFKESILEEIFEKLQDILLNCFEHNCCYQIYQMLIYLYKDSIENSSNFESSQNFSLYSLFENISNYYKKSNDRILIFKIQYDKNDKIFYNNGLAYNYFDKPENSEQQISIKENTFRDFLNLYKKMFDRKNKITFLKDKENYNLYKDNLNNLIVELS